MSDTETTPTGAPGAPQQFSIIVPDWWPRIAPTPDFADQMVQGLNDEQAAELNELFESVDPQDGTRLVAIITNGQPEPQSNGLMYINHSAQAARLMAGFVGINATPNEVPELRSIGKLRNTEVSTMQLEGVGAISCVTTRRQSPDPQFEGHGALLRIYLIPQPDSMEAVLVLFLTIDDERLREPFFEMADEIVGTFVWRY